MLLSVFHAPLTTAFRGERPLRFGFCGLETADSLARVDGVGVSPAGMQLGSNDALLWRICVGVSGGESVWVVDIELDATTTRNDTKVDSPSKLCITCASDIGPAFSLFFTVSAEKDLLFLSEEGVLES